MKLKSNIYTHKMHTNKNSVLYIILNKPLPIINKIITIVYYQGETKTLLKIMQNTKF